MAIVPKILAGAVLISLWLWSITAGFPFSTAFLGAHFVWFLAVPAWALALAPAYGVRFALSFGALQKWTTSALDR